MTEIKKTSASLYLNTSNYDKTNSFGFKGITGKIDRFFPQPGFMNPFQLEGVPWSPNTNTWKLRA